MKRTLALILFFFLPTALICSAQTGGGSAISETKFHVLRSVSGSKGSPQNGRFIVDDPRSVFYIPADKHVIVYFEWEGPIGDHHFEGYWKNPEGKVVVMSDFSYSATQKRFGGYWSLDVNEGIATGMWSLEARVDGEVTGTHTFEIIAAEKPPAAAAPPQPLSPADIYKKAQAASAFVDVLDAKGERIRNGSAFFIATGLAVTAFQIIDGANSVRLAFPDGSHVETNVVAKYDRMQDWAVLRVGGNASSTLLKAAKPKSWAVGDRCFSFEVPAEGNRVIVDENITGMHTFPEAGDRLNVSSPTWTSAIGSPVLNEYGDVIGVLGGSTHPGTHREDIGLTVAALREGSMVTPIDLVKLPSDETGNLTFEDLQRAGAFVAPITQQSDLLWAGFSAHFDVKKNEFPTMRESKTEFSKRDGQCEVMLFWNPRSKLRGMLSFRLYDVRNHVLAESAPGKLKGGAGQYVTNLWSFQVSGLKPSEYRVDVNLDNQTIWRGFVRVTE